MRANGIAESQIVASLRNIAASLKADGVSIDTASLAAIPDHNPKTILTLDATPVSYDKGIRTMNALDFLLGKEAL